MNIITLLKTVTIYRNILATPIMSKFVAFFSELNAFGDNCYGGVDKTDVASNSISRRVAINNLLEAYCDFVGEIYSHSNLGSFEEVFLDAMIHDDNVFTRSCSTGCGISDFHVKQARHELAIFFDIICTSSDECIKNIDDCVTKCNDDLAKEFKQILASLPRFISRHRPIDERDLGNDLQKFYDNCVEYASKYGVGIMCKYSAFICEADGGLIPVENIDPITFDDLKGYKVQKEELTKNIEAFLRGDSYRNVLMYGDRGTGKSSTVKAVLNKYKDEGLRLIQVGKKSFGQIEKLMRNFAKEKNGIIIYIDDLSLNDNDDDFGVLKTVLEGSIESKPKNIMIIATSNRRHLVKETFSSREGSEVHLADTLDETMSLADRFGLQITFLRPSMDEYIDIVKKLVTDVGINIDEKELIDGAERFAIRTAGRSPRVARQYIIQLRNGI